MTIKLLYTYLAHDVMQLTTRYAEARAKEPDTRDLAQMGDGQSDQELIMRFIMTGAARLRRVLRGKLVTPTEDATDILPTSDTPKGERPKTDSWEFTFNDTAEEADGEALAGLMHWFVVRWAVSEWCRMFSPNDLPIAKQDTKDTENEIDELLSEVAMPTKERAAKTTEDWPADIVYSYTTNT